jgi:hypothetical protein
MSIGTLGLFILIPLVAFVVMPAIVGITLAIVFKHRRNK